MRPTEKDCGNCGTTFEVKPKGRIPELCPDCRGKNVTQAHDGRPEGEGLGEDAEDTGMLEGAVPGAASTPAPPSDEPIHPVVDLPDVPDRVDSAIWTGDNLVEVREVLDDGVCIDWHRANGRPFAEVFGKDKDWFVDVKPGHIVWHDGVVTVV